MQQRRGAEVHRRVIPAPAKPTDADEREGFPTGISGEALAGRAQVPAQKFGARLAISRNVVRTDCDTTPYALVPVTGARANAGADSPCATSQPGAYAIGDFRSGSVKRVASGVGEGSVVVHSVHRGLPPVE